jgi:hypothetical protein
MTEVKKFSLLKPTLDTPFHIDFDWWRANDNNWRVALQDMLCTEHRESLSSFNEETKIDWVDPETAEVQRVEGLQSILINHCAKREDFLGEHTALVEGIFRLFLANGNMPLTARDLGTRLNRAPDIILKTIAGLRVYRGIRPYNP